MVKNRLVFVQTLLAAISCLLFLQKNSHAQQSRSEKCESLYKDAMHKYHSEDFEGALKSATQLREEFPDEPAGAFALLGTYQTMMVNYRTKLYESKFDSLLDLAVDLSKQAIKRDRKDGKSYFYLACAYGFRSMFNAQKKEWMAAFRDGMQISGNFERALKYSPEFYDSYYGLGLYNYWIGARAGKLRFLPFVDDSREEGLEQMRIAIDKAQFLDVDARYGLNMAYYNEGKFAEALNMTNDLLALFPNNPTLKYRKGRILQELQQWDQAKRVLKELHSILLDAEHQSLSYQIECLYQVAKCDYNLGNYENAQRLCARAILLEKKCDFSKELNGPFENYDQILDELHDLSDDLNAIKLTQNASQD